jgi:hypothetical protein
MNIFQLGICAVAIATFIFAIFIWLCDRATKRESEGCHQAHIKEMISGENKGSNGKILPENKSMHCAYCDQSDAGYCSKIRHHITNGYASLFHCKDCKDFVCRRTK